MVKSATFSRILRHFDPFLDMLTQIPGHTDPEIGQAHWNPVSGQILVSSNFGQVKF